jgi:hypothetical protein
MNAIGWGEPGGVVIAVTARERRDRESQHEYLTEESIPHPISGGRLTVCAFPS